MMRDSYISDQSNTIYICMTESCVLSLESNLLPKANKFARENTILYDPSHLQRQLITNI